MVGLLGDTVMMAVLHSLSDRLLGRGRAALTVPPMDGALKPNSSLEDAPMGIASNEPRGLALYKGRVIWASGNRILSESGEVAVAPADITAMAVSTEHRIALALDGAGVTLDSAEVPALARLSCITAMAFEGPATLWIAVGSTANPLNAWSRDFLEMRRSGQVWRYELSSGQLTCLGDRLGFPFGLLPTAQGLVVSESWERRLVRLGTNGKTETVADNLSGYPAGLSPSGDGGAWLAVFAPCNPLLELVLREPDYRKAMMAEVDPEFWIAPALRSGYSFMEPMQGGALKQMGLLKPWAPTRSYGLVVQLSAAFSPRQSLHSRAGGKRHGVTAVLEHDARLWAASTGGHEVLSLAVDTGGGE